MLLSFRLRAIPGSPASPVLGRWGGIPCDRGDSPGHTSTVGRLCHGRRRENLSADLMTGCRPFRVHPVSFWLTTIAGCQVLVSPAPLPAKTHTNIANRRRRCQEKIEVVTRRRASFVRLCRRLASSSHARCAEAIDRRPACETLSTPARLAFPIRAIRVHPWSGFAFRLTDHGRSPDFSASEKILSAIRTSALT